MFRLAFAIVFALLLWLQSLWTDTVHTVNGDTHHFGYNWVPFLFLGLFFLTLIAFAEIARRWLKDIGLAIICLLAIPLFGFTSLQIFYERVELTEQFLIHRREPPHTKYNADIRWDAIQSVTRLKRERADFNGPTGEFNVGYEVHLQNGETRELPANTVLTRAAEEIEKRLAARMVPIDEKVFHLPR